MEDSKDVALEKGLKDIDMKVIHVIRDASLIGTSLNNNSLPKEIFRQLMYATAQPSNLEIRIEIKIDSEYNILAIKVLYNHRTISKFYPTVKIELQGSSCTKLRLCHLDVPAELVSNTLHVNTAVHSSTITLERQELLLEMCTITDTNDELFEIIYRDLTTTSQTTQLPINFESISAEQIRNLTPRFQIVEPDSSTQQQSPNQSHNQANATENINKIMQTLIQLLAKILLGFEAIKNRTSTEQNRSFTHGIQIAEMDSSPLQQSPILNQRYSASNLNEVMYMFDILKLKIVQVFNAYKNQIPTAISTNKSERPIGVDPSPVQAHPSISAKQIRCLTPRLKITETDAPILKQLLDQTLNQTNIGNNTEVMQTVERLRMIIVQEFKADMNRAPTAINTIQVNSDININRNLTTESIPPIHIYPQLSFMQLISSCKQCQEQKSSRERTYNIVVSDQSLSGPRRGLVSNKLDDKEERGTKAGQKQKNKSSEAPRTKKDRNKKSKSKFSPSQEAVQPSTSSNTNTSGKEGIHLSNRTASKYKQYKNIVASEQSSSVPKNSSVSNSNKLDDKGEGATKPKRHQINKSLDAPKTKTDQHKKSKSKFSRSQEAVQPSISSNTNTSGEEGINLNNKKASQYKQKKNIVVSDQSTFVPVNSSVSNSNKLDDEREGATKTERYQNYNSSEACKTKNDQNKKKKTKSSRSQTTEQSSASSNTYTSEKDGINLNRHALNNPDQNQDIGVSDQLSSAPKNSSVSNYNKLDDKREEATKTELHQNNKSSEVLKTKIDQNKKNKTKSSRSQTTEQSSTSSNTNTNEKEGIHLNRHGSRNISYHNQNIVVSDKSLAVQRCGSVSNSNKLDDKRERGRNQNNKSSDSPKTKNKQNISKSSRSQTTEQLSTSLNTNTSGKEEIYFSRTASKYKQNQNIVVSEQSSSFPKNDSVNNSNKLDENSDTKLALVVTASQGTPTDSAAKQTHSTTGQKISKQTEITNKKRSSNMARAQVRSEGENQERPHTRASISSWGKGIKYPNSSCLKPDATKCNNNVSLEQPIQATNTSFSTATKTGNDKDVKLIKQKIREQRLYFNPDTKESIQNSRKHKLDTEQTSCTQNPVSSISRAPNVSNVIKKDRSPTLAKQEVLQLSLPEKIFTKIHKSKYIQKVNSITMYKIALQKCSKGKKRNKNNKTSMHKFANKEIRQRYEAKRKDNDNKPELISQVQDANDLSDISTQPSSTALEENSLLITTRKTNNDEPKIKKLRTNHFPAKSMSTETPVARTSRNQSKTLGTSKSTFSNGKSSNLTTPNQSQDAEVGPKLTLSCKNKKTIEEIIVKLTAKLNLVPSDSYRKTIATKASKSVNSNILEQSCKISRRKTAITRRIRQPLQISSTDIVIDRPLNIINGEIKSSNSQVITPNTGVCVPLPVTLVTLPNLCHGVPRNVPELLSPIASDNSNNSTIGNVPPACGSSGNNEANSTESSRTNVQFQVPLSLPNPKKRGRKPTGLRPANVKAKKSRQESSVCSQLNPNKNVDTEYMMPNSDLTSHVTLDDNNSSGAISPTIYADAIEFLVTHRRQLVSSVSYPEGSSNLFSTPNISSVLSQTNSNSLVASVSQPEGSTNLFSTPNISSVLSQTNSNSLVSSVSYPEESSNLFITPHISSVLSQTSSNSLVSSVPHPEGNKNWSISSKSSVLSQNRPPRSNSPSTFEQRTVVLTTTRTIESLPLKRESNTQLKYCSCQSPFGVQSKALDLRIRRTSCENRKFDESKPLDLSYKMSDLQSKSSLHFKQDNDENKSSSSNVPQINLPEIKSKYPQLTCAKRTPQNTDTLRTARPPPSYWDTNRIIDTTNTLPARNPPRVPIRPPPTYWDRDPIVDAGHVLPAFEMPKTDYSLPPPPPYDSVVTDVPKPKRSALENSIAHWEFPIGETFQQPLFYTETSSVDTTEARVEQALPSHTITSQECNDPIVASIPDDLTIPDFHIPLITPPPAPVEVNGRLVRPRARYEILSRCRSPPLDPIIFPMLPFPQIQIGPCAVQQRAAQNKRLRNRRLARLRGRQNPKSSGYNSRFQALLTDLETLLMPPPMPRPMPSPKQSPMPHLLPHQMPPAMPSPIPPTMPRPMPSPMLPSMPHLLPHQMPPSMPPPMPRSMPSPVLPSMPHLLPHQIPPPMPSPVPRPVPRPMPSPMPRPMPSPMPRAMPSPMLPSMPHLLPHQIPPPMTSPMPRPMPSPMLPSMPHLLPHQIPPPMPSPIPSTMPRSMPHLLPHQMPPSMQPTMHPAMQHAMQHAMHPAMQPTMQPAMQPAMHPAMQHAMQSAMQSAMQPAMQSSMQPAMQPAMQAARPVFTMDDFLLDQRHHLAMMGYRNIAEARRARAAGTLRHQRGAHRSLFEF